MAGLSELRIVCAGDSTSLIRRSDNGNLADCWFSLSDALFFLARTGSSSVRDVVSQLDLSQKKDINNEWWVTKDGLLKVCVQANATGLTEIRLYAWLDLQNNK